MKIQHPLLLAASFFSSFNSRKVDLQYVKSEVFRIEHEYQIPGNKHMISATSAMPKYKRDNYFSVKKFSKFNPIRITRQKDNVCIRSNIPQINLFQENGSERPSTHA